MPQPKFKSENYQNLGGIDSKTSQYLTSPLSFLDIKNMDFQTPGALTQRWGSTMYVGQTLSGKINALTEFSRLDGSSYVIFGSSGGLWSGATTGQSQGLSLTNVGSTLAFRYGFFVTSATSTTNIISIPAPFFYHFDQKENIFLDQGGTYVIFPENFSSNYVDSVEIVNQLFIVNGSAFLRYDGITTYNVGLPFPTSTYQAKGVSVPQFALHVTLNNAAAGTTVGIGNATFSSYAFYISYLNNRGFESQIWPLTYTDYSNAIGTTPLISGSFIQMWADINVPLSHGITSINVYSFASVTLMGSGWGVSAALWDPDYVLMGNYPVDGSTIVTIPLGTSLGNFPNMLNNIGNQPNPNSNLYFPLGATMINSAFNYGGFTNAPDSAIRLTDYFPSYIEAFQNRLFLSGFSLTPSTVWFSEDGEPEAYKADSNFEVRTNDADVITALKAYQTKLYIFKKNSFFVFSGDNPSNFFLQEVSLLYGCLNNRSVVTYENILLFLDRKGVMMFNGANIECLSNKIQPIFDRMNYSAALTEACMVHDKLRNQILCAIPVDGSSINNLVVVYDYLAGAWTTHTGYSPSIFASIQGRNNSKNVFYGSYSGMINWQGSSFLSDNGAGYTLSFKPRFLHDMGESVQKVFRRLYLNADPVGSTLSMPINFYQDYGISIVYSTTFVLGAFQNRIDYGISAKSLAFELFNLNTSSSPLRIYGFTIESRMQRLV